VSDQRERCVRPGARTLERQTKVGGPPWQIPVTLLVLGALAQLTAAVGLVAIARDLAQGIFDGPTQLAVVHLYGLGFLTLTIVGALLQLVPVVVRQQIASPPVVTILGAALAMGAWLLAGGLWSGAAWSTSCGGTLLVVGGGVFVGYLTRALWRAGRTGTLGAPGAGIALAGLWFAIVLILGAVLAANTVHPFLQINLYQFIGAHAAVATIGWIGGTILAMALRLAPMFVLAHGYWRAPGMVALILWNLAVAPIAIGIGIGSAPLALAGGVVLLAACAAAATFLASVVRHRRRRLEAPIVHLALGLIATTGATAALMLTRAGTFGLHQVVVPAVLSVLVGLGAGVASGHLFKVVPMLVWTGRYAHLTGVGGAPKLSDLYPSSLATVEQWAFLSGLALLVGGTAGRSGTVAEIGAGLLLLAAAAVAVAVATIVVGRPRARFAPPIHLSSEPAA
jgi:hypothetical protein